MEFRSPRLSLVLLILVSVALLPGMPVDADGVQCKICDNIHGHAVCLPEDPPSIAYRSCTAGEICLQIGGGTVCFPEACWQSGLCILYL